MVLDGLDACAWKSLGTVLAAGEAWLALAVVQWSGNEMVLGSALSLPPMVVVQWLVGNVSWG